MRPFEGWLIEPQCKFKNTKSSKGVITQFGGR
jgi:hypothetical protein